jgi:hypothetical protein
MFMSLGRVKSSHTPARFVPKGGCHKEHHGIVPVPYFEKTWTETTVPPPGPRATGMWNDCPAAKLNLEMVVLSHVSPDKVPPIVYEPAGKPKT